MAPLGLATSVSRIDISIGIQGKGIAEGEIFRHLAPMSVGLLVRSSPIHGRLIRQKGFVSILTRLEAGVERGRTHFTRGELAFFAMNGSICVFFEDSDLPRPMNPLGRISKGVEVIETAGPGVSATLTVHPPRPPADTSLNASPMR